MPEFIAFPDFPTPIHCGVGDSDEIHVIATHVSFETVEDVVKEVNFSIYKLDGLPVPNFRLGDIVLTRYENGQVDQVLITYEQYMSEVNRWVTTISISSRFTFPAPYPVAFTPADLVADGLRDFPTLIEKVSYLPTNGLQVSTAEGYVYYWVENSILYTLINEPAYGESATELTKLLRLVK
ncbi:MAG: hypothetical protein M5U34_04380 [Chloroflexi bacterium]|nr:hypothetical protein [Chloroflexota bacterium]